MNKKRVAQIAGWSTLAIMALIGISFYANGENDVWPRVLVFSIASWIHGICWGFRYALEGRFTWL